jgi:hypothetical protein
MDRQPPDSETGPKRKREITFSEFLEVWQQERAKEKAEGTLKAFLIEKGFSQDVAEYVTTTLAAYTADDLQHLKLKDLWNLRDNYEDMSELEYESLIDLCKMARQYFKLRPLDHDVSELEFLRRKQQQDTFREVAQMLALPYTLHQLCTYLQERWKFPLQAATYVTKTLEAANFTNLESLSRLSKRRMKDMLDDTELSGLEFKVLENICNGVRKKLRLQTLEQEEQTLLEQEKAAWTERKRQREAGAGASGAAAGANTNSFLANQYFV